MKLILLGAPGAGKGTQASAISAYLAIPVISTGNIIRDALKSGSAMGVAVASYMDDGRLVPDEVVIEIIRERLCEDDCASGFILDGFPRTLTQAEALDRLGIEVDLVIEVAVDDDVITGRISGRRVCGQCGEPYHVVYKLPLVDGVCDKCSGTLTQREDDRDEIVRQRLRVYHEQTVPLKAYYTGRGIMAVVPGQEKVEDTEELTLQVVQKWQGKR